MITFNVQDYNVSLGSGASVPYVEGSCLAADTKPTTVANGSKLIEMDSGKLYIFDAAGSTWREI